MTALHQVMGPSVCKLTSKILQFSKVNDTNYHIWSDNMQSALLAKSLWGVVFGHKKCPSKPLDEHPGVMTTLCPAADSLSTVIWKDGQELADVIKSKGYVTWEQSIK
ncbi:hypothetical protein C0992_004388, partial [Termitomyces sp. T32_za158]